MTFIDLQRLTSKRNFPQIFVNETFIGGLHELKVKIFWNVFVLFYDGYFIMTDEFHFSKNKHQVFTSTGFCSQRTPSSANPDISRNCGQKVWKMYCVKRPPQNGIRFESLWSMMFLYSSYRGRRSSCSNSEMFSKTADQKTVSNFQYSFVNHLLWRTSKMEHYIDTVELRVQRSGI